MKFCVCGSGDSDHGPDLGLLDPNCDPDPRIFKWLLLCFL